jgi:hypothetical protein
MEEELKALQAQVRELREAIAHLSHHGLRHELSGDDIVRLSVQNGGIQLNRQRTLNASTGLTATESSANKRIDLTLALTTYLARCSGDLTLTTSYQDVAGATVTLAAIGTYMIWAVFDFELNTVSANLAQGELNVDGVGQTGVAGLRVNASHRERGTYAQMWEVTTTGVNEIAKLRALKTVDDGTGTCYTSSCIMALRIA